MECCRGAGKTEQVATDQRMEGLTVKMRERTEISNISHNILEDSVDLESIYKAGFKFSRCQSRTSETRL